MENLATGIGQIGYACLIVAFFTLCVFVFIAPWRCWVWLKRLHAQQEEIDSSRRQEATAMLNVLGDIAKLQVKTNQGIDGLRKAVEGIKIPTVVAASAAPRPDVLVCPVCKGQMDRPEGVQEGQHVRCPYCNHKFEFHAA